MNARIATAPGSRAERVQRVRSPAGVEAWLVEDYAVPLIAMEFAWRGGAAQDPADKAGLAAMLAGLIDEGAGDYDSAAFHEALDEHAIHLHFSADRDTLAGHFQTLSRNADAAFDLLRLAVGHARLDEAPIERVRAQLVASLKREANDPESLVARTFRARAFPNHPYGQPPRGDMQTLARIARPDLVDALARLMARDNLVIGVVGAIDAATLARRLDDTFATLPEKATLKDVPRVEIGALGERIVVDLDTPQSALRFGRPGLDRRDPDYYAGVVVNHVLGGGVFTARLFREVREKRGLAYSVYSQLQNFEAAALVVGATSTKNERAAESLQVIEEQIADLGLNGPTEEELAKAKRYLVGSHALHFDTSTKIAGQLLHLQLDGYEPAHLDRRNGLIENVALEDARRAAQRMLGDGKLLVAVAGRPQGI